MFKKIKKATDQERQLHYGDGPLQSSGPQVAAQIRMYAEAGKWFEKHLADEYRKKARNSRILAVIFGFIAVLALVAVAGLTPLKTVEPYVIRVDQSSGYVDVVRPYVAGDAPDVAEEKHYIALYVMARESYHWNAQRANYALVRLFSSPEVFAEYKNFQLSSKGYVSSLGQNGQVRTAVEAIIPLPVSAEPKLKSEKNVKSWQVRFTQTRLNADGQPPENTKPVHWVATVTFNYGKPSVSEGEQWLNPKGFQVLDYNKTEDLQAVKQ